MDGDPRPGRLGELVVHVVGLVQEQLQHQAVVRPGQGHFPHSNLDRRAQLGDSVSTGSSQYFWAQARVEREAVPILWMREGIPVPGASLSVSLSEVWSELSPGVRAV